ncbi:MAG: ribosome silencing factor [Acidimicrobiales bacterium]
MTEHMPESDSLDGARDVALAVTDWAVAAARVADEKLGQRTVVIDVAAVLAITDSFVITSGRNKRQVRAIAEEIEEHLTAAGGPKPIRIEGRDEYRWLLMDYGDFIVHVFDEDSREYYELERLWNDQPRVGWQPEP